MTITQRNPFSAYYTKEGKTARTVGRNWQSVVVMVIVSAALGLGIVPRLAYLQILEGDRNRQLAENNRVRIIPRAPVRGNIFDRHGKILASSRFSHAVYVWPLAIRKENWLSTRRTLARILNIPESEIQERLEKEGAKSPSLVRIARGISPSQFTEISENRLQVEGVELDIESIRNYPNGDLAAHILGYTGEMNEEELVKKRSQGYRMGDVVGQMGVEAAFESILRGEWGGQQVEVDSSGQVLQILGQKQTQAGRNVQLTIDLDLQKAVEQNLAGRTGAIVVMDVRNGGILAMASYPTYDPNIFSSRITPEVWQQLQGRGNPFLNRALRGFPPASTFKIVTAAAGMENGKYPPNTILPTYAALNLGGSELGEWNLAGFGPLGFVEAMAMSSNTFFGQVARGIGGPELIAWTRRFGFGQKTGIELAAEESPGLVADDEWKQENYNWEWTVGDTVNMSIGQGFTLATPLQVAVMFAVPANGGFRVKPHLLKDNEDAQNWRESLNMKPDTIRVIREGLRGVVTFGTGQALGELPIPTAGKSGTAEAPPRESHAWFGAYAPADNPEIVVVAFAEHSGGGGGSVTGPMVAKVIQAYHDLKRVRAGLPPSSKPSARPGG
jgi:penicillin-binding protein 2